ncbi:MAG: septum formation family protein, partial [Nitriliruptorales bacterium]|nr:septum formation family protein [Nitriliruptorales bacterium]
MDCEEPHDNEIYAVVVLPGGDYPEDIADQAQDHCEGD